MGELTLQKQQEKLEDRLALRWQGRRCWDRIGGPGGGGRGRSDLPRLGIAGSFFAIEVHHSESNRQDGLRDSRLVGRVLP